MQKKILFLVAMTAVASVNAQNFNVDGYEAVDLGLSVLWATCNVGADSPEKFGNYFDFNDIEIDFNLTEIADEYDFATQKMGEKWRMPTKEELEELLNCEWEFDETKKGYFVKNNGNSIFLPRSGFNNGILTNSEGNYWTRTISVNSKLWSLFFSNSGTKRIASENAGVAFTIRAVCEKSAVTKLNYVEKDKLNTVYKTFENGQIVIIKNGVKYNLRGQNL